MTLLFCFVSFRFGFAQWLLASSRWRRPEVPWFSGSGAGATGPAGVSWWLPSSCPRRLGQCSPRPPLCLFPELAAKPVDTTVATTPSSPTTSRNLRTTSPTSRTARTSTTTATATSSATNLYRGLGRMLR